MKLRTAALAALCTTFALAGLPAAAGAGTSPLKVLTFSASAKVTIDPVSGQKYELDADYWVDRNMLRTEITDQRNKVTFGTIIRDRTVYSWTLGEQSGRKTTFEPGDPTQAPTFADIADCLAKAKSGGDEEVGGVACERWSYKGCGGEGETTVWIAKEGGWVKKLQNKSANGTITSEFRAVETRSIPEDRFSPPARIPFIGIPKPTTAAKKADEKK